MYPIRSLTVDNDFRAIMEHLLCDPVLNPASPIRENYSPYFQVKWGERITKCERGVPMISVFPDGQNEAPNGLQQFGRFYFLRFQVVAGGDDRTNEDLFYECLSRIKTVFGLQSGDFTFSTPFEFIHEGKRETIDAGFRLGALGISRSEIFASASPRRLQGDCQSLYVEILARFTIYLSSC